MTAFYYSDKIIKIICAINSKMFTERQFSQILVTFEGFCDPFYTFYTDLIPS